MTTRQRIAFALAAIAVAVAAVALLVGGDAPDGRRDAAPRTATPGPAGTAVPQEAGPVPTAERARTPTIEVRGGRVLGGAAELEAAQGETVRFRVRSDTADEVHVHGLDVTRAVPAGGSAELRFRADVTGIFEIELERLGLELARLRVDP